MHFHICKFSHLHIEFMIVRSMTGYGKAVCQYKDKNFNIEIRSVNSKQLDVSLRCPGIYKEKELEIRNELTRSVERGKVDVIINVEQTEAGKVLQINKGIVKDYFIQIKAIADELNLPVNEYILATALRMPETMKMDWQQLDPAEWKVISKGISDAIAEFTAFRVQEGKALEKDILERIDLIEKNLEELEAFESTRVSRIRERIARNLNDFIPNAALDNNRFEQEIIFFLEKLDVTEEKVRLRNHCHYFKQTFKEESSGRKLGFISQEIGREINTIGSKANDSDIQRHVVMMKDELEKVKEQLLNIL